jgi:hypothetical protein
MQLWLMTVGGVLDHGFVLEKAQHAYPGWHMSRPSMSNDAAGSNAVTACDTFSCIPIPWTR